MLGDPTGELPEISIPKGLLQQDGCIIEDQPDHLVIAIRVPKATISANMALFAAMSDGLGQDKPPVIVPVAPVKRKGVTRLYAAAILVALALPSPFWPDISSAAIHLIKPPAPVEYRAWHMTKAIYHIGEPLVVVLEFLRNRECMTTVDRSISFAAPPTRVAFSSRNYAAGSGPNKDWGEFRAAISSPPLKPGEYIYRGNTHSDCERGGSYDAQHDAIPFTVIE